MKIQLLKNTLKTAALAAILAGGLVIVSTGEVSAQAPPPPQPEAARSKREMPPREANLAPRGPRRDRDEGADIFRAAREQGMRDGQLRGGDDRSRNKNYRPDKTGSYKKATNGYLSGSDNKDAYKSSYRQGFLKGYERGYNGAPPERNEAGPVPPRPETRPLPPSEKGPKEPREQKPRPPAPNGDQPPAPDRAQPPAPDGGQPKSAEQRPDKQKRLKRPGDDPALPPPPPSAGDPKPVPPIR